MANNVFANGREISCKKAEGKSICAFPDVCFTPPDKVPPTPPGVPIPYPNTAMAKDAAKGSKKVKISGQEVMLKNKSYFKTSVGNEAGCATKKGVLTSKTKGKAYFTAWSMDVKVEGENVVRSFDLTTHNHGSFPCNTSPWPYVDEATLGNGSPCDGVDQKYRMTPYGHGCEDEYTDDKGKVKNKTPHHVIPDRQMRANGGGKRFENYTHYSAPCLCVTGSNQHSGEHKDYHEVVDTAEYMAHSGGGGYSYAEAREKAVESASTATGREDAGKPEEEKSEETKKIEACVRLQLDNFYKERCKAEDTSPVRASGKRGKRIAPAAKGGSSGGA